MTSIMTKRSVSRLVSKSGMRRLIAGSGGKKSVLSQVLIYVLLTGVSFTFLYPILCFLSASGMDAYDLVDPLVNWLPRSFNTDNFVKAYNALGGYQTALSSLFWMGIVAVVQTVVSAMVAYGFAKHDFPFRRILFALMIATFFIPKQVSFLPEYVMFTTYKMDNSILPVLLPTIFGQGLRHAIFILIYVQFFRMAPPSLDEAASIDGASQLGIFLKINLRAATPATIVVFIFSLVWNWNETTLADTYFGKSLVTLPLALQRFRDTFTRMYPVVDTQSIEAQLNQGVEMAAAMLSIIPLLLIYVLVERKLIESIDKSGITGE